MPQPDESTPKIGAGHAQAMFRLGLKELREAAYFPESNVAQPAEIGLYGTSTQMEINAQRRDDVQGPSEEKGSILAEREQYAATRAREENDRDDRNRDSRGMDKE